MTTNKHITADGTHFWTYGKPTQPTIIMVHGFRGTHHGLDLIAQQLPGHYIIVPDVPGFGESRPLKKHDISHYVQWLHDFITHHKLSQPPVLLGHSFGSIISAAYAAKYPKTISKLILVNPIGAPALEGPRALLTKLALFYYWSGRKLPEKTARKWLSLKPAVAMVTITMTKSRDKHIRKYVHSQHFQYFSLFHDLQSLSESFSTSVNHNVREFAHGITVPTLLVVGEKDDITPLAKQQELVRLFPNAQLHMIKSVGHLTHYETPDQVAASIEDFI